MKPEHLKVLTYTCVVLASLSSIVAMASGISPDHEVVFEFLSATAQSQIAQAGFFFTAAAWIHGSRVKREIKHNFIGLTAAINNVAVTLREDLTRHTSILENLEGRVQNLESTIKNNKPKPE